jgi:hypothetical protein
MAVTNFTPLLGLALPTTGDLSGTWGTTVNDAITDLLDDAVAGTVTLSADADVTLSTTNGADNQARNAVILWTASNGASTRNITAPAQSKAYVVINAGTGSIVLRGAGPTTGVTIVVDEKCLAAWNGSDFVKVSSTATAEVNTTATSTNADFFIPFVAAATTGPQSLGVDTGVTYNPSTDAFSATGFMSGVFSDRVVTLGNIGAALTLNASQGTVYTATLNQSGTLTLGSPNAASSRATSFTLILTNGSGGPYTLTLAGGTFKYSDGTISRTTTAGAIDIWFFFTPDGGTTYYVSIPIKNAS